MSQKTGIEWTDSTWNPLRGCSIHSPGCTNCYAMQVAHRFSGPGLPYEGLTKLTSQGPKWTGEIKLVPAMLPQPIQWQRPRKIFVNSMSDLFHDGVPDDFIDKVFGIMWACLYTRNGEPGHIFQVLTKRPDRMRNYLSVDRSAKWAHATASYCSGTDPGEIYEMVLKAAKSPHPRVWLGTSIENQTSADERVDFLLDTPAAVRWVSAEPLLGPIDITRWLKWIDWCVVGGESGRKARHMLSIWAQSLRDQCSDAQTAYYFKQWGKWLPTDQVREHLFTTFGNDLKAGKKSNGRLLDGKLHLEFPTSTDPLRFP